MYRSGREAGYRSYLKDGQDGGSNGGQLGGDITKGMQIEVCFQGNANIISADPRRRQRPHLPDFVPLTKRGIYRRKT